MDASWARDQASVFKGVGQACVPDAERPCEPVGSGCYAVTVPMQCS